MKKILIIGAVLCSAVALAYATDFVKVYLHSGSELTFDVAGLKITFDEEGTNVNFGESVTLPLTQIDSLSFYQKEEPLVGNDTVYINWEGTTATVTNPYTDSISVTNTTGVVTVKNLLTKEICYVLSGSGKGSFKLYSEKKQKLFLRNLTLTSTDGGAINIQSKKTTAVKLQGTSTLTDATSWSGCGEEDMKGCFFSEGQLEFEQQGTLKVKGNYKHAICSDDYIEMKNCSIYVTGTNSNAIHVNDYFQMKSGYLNITTTTAASKGIKSGGNIWMDGGTAIFKQSGSYTTEDNDPSYVCAIKATDSLVVNDGNITITNSGTAGRGLSSDNILQTNGGKITITNSGAAVAINNEYSTAKGFLCDGVIQILGGDITIKMTGTGGKGVKTDGNLIVGNTDGTGPTLVVGTTGSAAGNTGGGGGGGGGNWRPGGGGGGPGGGGSTGSSAKAMKCMGLYYQYGGDVTITTTTNGAEGIESKTKAANSMNFLGGTLKMTCYDDCLNSAGAMNFKGTKVLCISTGNDAIDSNYGRTGSIIIGDGVVVGLSLCGDPEEGIDCDNNSYININGGYVFSAGGAQGGGGSSSSSIGTSSQSYCIASSGSYTTNRYYTLADASGNNLFTFKWPATKSVSSKLSLISSPLMKKGSTYNIKYSTTAPTDAQISFGDFFYIGSTTKGSSTTISTLTAK